MLVSRNGGKSCWKVNECHLHTQLGPRKLSVIWSSGMSAIQGLLKYRSEWEDSRDFQNCPLYRECPLLRVSVKWGSTVLYYPQWWYWQCVMKCLLFHCLLLSHLQSSSQYSNQQGKCCGHSHITWGLSTPSPHTKNQPANIRLLLHSWKHVWCIDLHLAALHSSLAHFTTHCSFCVVVLCVQLPWQ